jgi:excisionase family DNA binding protein
VEFLLTTEAAELIGVSPDTIRVWERCGRLPAAHKTSRNVRLFRREDCIRVAQNRATAAYLLSPPVPDDNPEPEKERDAVSTVPR